MRGAQATGMGLLLTWLGCTAGPAAQRPQPAVAPAAPAVAPAEPELQQHAGNPVLSSEEIAVTALDGAPVRLRDVTAPVTVVGFWASFCKPCIRELPYLDALYRAHRDQRGVAVLAMNVDEPADLQAAREIIAPLHLALPLLADQQATLRRRINGLLGKDAGGREMTLPLVLIVDQAAHLWSEVGFQQGVSTAQYIAAKDELIAQAAAGRLPERRPERYGQAPPGAILRLSFHRLKAAEIREQLPQVRAQLLQVSPQLGEADLARLLSRVEKAMRAGGQVRLQLPR